MTTPSLSQKIAGIALPTTAEHLLLTLVGFLDTWMIAQLGLTVVTGIGLANSFFATYIAVFAALGVGVASLVSRYQVKSIAKASAIASELLVLGLLLSLLMGLGAVIFSRPILELLGATETVIAETDSYVKLIGSSCFTLLISTVLGQLLRVNGDAKASLVINSLVNLINVLCDYVLIFG